MYKRYPVVYPMATTVLLLHAYVSKETDYHNSRRFVNKKILAGPLGPFIQALVKPSSKGPDV